MSAVIAQQPVDTARWRLPLAAWLTTVAVLVVSYYGTASTMVGIWLRSETFAHAIVVPLLSLWMAWRLRGELAALQPRPALWVALPLLAMALVWRLGHLVQIDVIEQFMFTAMLVATVPAVLGMSVARTLMFPLGFLFFAVPFGEFMTPTLVSFTADFAVAAVRFSGVPVLREGDHFSIPSGSWAVVEECSGIRYLMASAMVGALFAYLNYRAYGRRWAFVAVSLVVPIVANWLRAYMIVMIGHLSGNRLATGVDHIIYGWVFFGIVITLMFMIGARWADSVEPERHPPRQSLAGPATSASQWLAAAALAVVATAGLQLGLQSWLNRSAVTTNASAQPQWPPTLAPGWVAEPAGKQVFSPRFVGPGSEPQQVYRGPDGALVWAYLAHYPQQDEAHRLVSSVNVVVRSTDDVWNLARRQEGAVSDVPGLPAVMGYDITPNAGASHMGLPRLRAWRFYRIDGQTTHSDVRAKGLQAWQQLRGHGSAGSAVLLYTQADSDQAADSRLAAFARANLPAVLEWLDGLPVQR